jgi:hypothetical protein
VPLIARFERAYIVGELLANFDASFEVDNRDKISVGYLGKHPLSSGSTTLGFRECDALPPVNVANAISKSRRRRERASCLLGFRRDAREAHPEYIGKSWRVLEGKTTGTRGRPGVSWRERGGGGTADEDARIS